jgi:acyl-CoA dehydrogenase
VNRTWPRDALNFASTVAAALSDLGGVDMARKAEVDPALRQRTIAPALDRLGLRELDPWGSDDESAAAVLAVRAAGAVVLSWPLGHELAVPPESRSSVAGILLATPGARRAEHADLLRRCASVDPSDDWRVRLVAPASAVASSPLDPFSCAVEPAGEQADLDGARAGFMRALLDGYWVAGATDSVVRLATTHARDRVQFGVPIGSFGEIRWRIADMVLARDGLDELCLYTWWRMRQGRAAESDVLALRVHMIESANTALSNGHQVLGAMGLCEEHDLTVIDRHLQPVLRRPAGLVASAGLLAAAVGRVGFEATFPVKAWN